MRRACKSTRWPVVVLAVLIPGAGSTGTAADTTHASEWPANAYVLQVDGLACPYCGYGIEKQFSRQEGVEGTDIDIEAGTVIISVTAGTRFPTSELKRIIHDAGFALGGIVQRPRGE